MKTDIEIAQSAEIKNIEEIANKLGIDKENLELHGKYKAKLPLKLIDEDKIKKSKLILSNSCRRGKNNRFDRFGARHEQAGKKYNGSIARTVIGSCIWHKGRCCRRRSFASNTNGRHKPTLYR